MVRAYDVYARLLLDTRVARCENGVIPALH